MKAYKRALIIAGRMNFPADCNIPVSVYAPAVNIIIGNIMRKSSAASFAASSLIFGAASFIIAREKTMPRTESTAQTAITAVIKAEEYLSASFSDFSFT